jgi:hypothetical protein
MRVGDGDGDGDGIDGWCRAWIFFSNTTILFNKWLIDNRGFSKFLRHLGIVVFADWWD